MKFSVVDEYTYWWPIKVERPDEKRSGHWKTESFEMQFAAIDQDTAKAMQDEITALPTLEERMARQYDEVLKAARNWRGVVDAEGEEVPFSIDMLETMMKAATWYRAGIFKSFYGSLSKDEGRKGN